MDISTIPILSIVAFLPLVGAIAVAILPASAARGVALGFALLTFIVSLFLLIGYLPGRVAFQFVETLDWIPVFGIQYKVGADCLRGASLTAGMEYLGTLGPGSYGDKGPNVTVGYLGTGGTGSLDSLLGGFGS